ncbi:MAG TPA: pitrilysin family protein [Thermoanaerobaculia bacterium]|nr:pitrilysin family protein [Thermoanaerobaculia bacterium]
MNAPRETPMPRALAFAAAFLGLAAVVAPAPGPAQEAARAPAGPAGSAPAERPEELVFPPLPDFDVPEPTRVELDNGLVVLLMPDHELPLVRAVAVVKTGGRLEPAAKVGLAGIAGSVLRLGGTESLGPDELDDFLESRAAVIESSIGESQGRVTLSALAEDFPEVLRVFADVLRRPAFAPERIEVAFTQARAGVARQNDNPQTILFRELDEQVYGPGSPYARTPTFATLTAIERDDLLAWHRTYYRPDRTILGLSGDFEPEAALALVRDAFGDWRPPAGAEPAPGAPEGAYREEPAPGVFVAEKSDITQSNIALGLLGIVKSHPDFYAVEVMNEVLGGSMTSRLFSEVRTRKGLAYAVGGRVGSGWDHPGATILFTTTKVETTGEAIRALLEEARGMTARPPTDEEVARAKRAILASFVFRIDSPRRVLEQQLTFEYFGYPLDWLSTYRDRIEAVTPEAVRRAAAEHLRPDSFSIVVVGPAEGRDVDLSTFGPVRELDITIPPPAAAGGV